MKTGPWDFTRDFAAASGVILNASQKPYSAYSNQIETARLNALAIRRAGEVLRSGALVACAREEDRQVALAAVTTLPWDSEQLGRKTARLDLFSPPRSSEGVRAGLHELVGDTVVSCQATGVEHLSVRVGAGDLAAVHALEAHGFEMLDGIQTFSLEMRQPPRFDEIGSWETRLSRPSDEDELARIAGDAFRLDRFHADASISEQSANRVYEEWARNSCRLTAADAVTIAEDADGVCGFVACKVDHETKAALGISFASITLVATSGRSIGRGVAAGNTQYALRWLWERGVRIVEVGTQLRNVTAGRVYERAGFRLRSVSLTMRKLFTS